ncbi:MAG: fumarylacetoacetate hydrolase family protein [Acidimicrobiales bacterium]
MPFTLANLDGRAQLVVAGGLFDLERRSGGRLPADPMAALALGDALSAEAARLAAAGEAPDRPLEGAALDAPVPRPQKVFGIGLNYRSHAAESNMDLPDTPLVFAKFPNCICGPTADVVLNGAKTDWEVELVAVIGRRCRRVAAADAWSAVGALTVGQDISDRKLQFATKPPQFNLGKSCDTFGPIGPVLVSPDSFADPTDLGLTCDITGVPKQDARTKDLIFTVADLVAYLSGICTLEPGDLIFTGTPDGVGAAQGQYLTPGDVITSTIEGIGTLVNRCVAPTD